MMLVGYAGRCFLFWEAAGDSLLVPRLHPGLDVNIFNKLGTILSHGYLDSRITLVLGAKEGVPDSFVMLDTLNSHERGIVQSALKFDCETFPQDLRNKLIGRFDGIPTPNTQKEILGQLANFHFHVRQQDYAI